MFPYLLVEILLGSCYCSKEGKTLGRPELFGPSVVLVNDIVDFKCQLLSYPKNETVLLEFFKEGNRNKSLGFYSSSDGEVATFPIVIKTYHQGNLECVGTVQNNSHVEPSVSYPHNLKVIEPVAGAKVIIEFGGDEFFEGETLQLRCTLTSGNHAFFKWLVNGQPVLQSPLHHVVKDQLFIYRSTSADSGSYMCVATNHYNATRVFTSNSLEVQITVKDVISVPDISFSVLTEDSLNYFALVTCQSIRGTLPVTFSLYKGTELAYNTTVDERKATFKIPLVLDRHLGWFQCQANNGNEVAYSQWLPLEVVSVGGPVAMHYDYDIGENYAVVGLRFYCKATKGSYPRYRWFLNKTLLQDRGDFYYIFNQQPDQSILMLSVEGSIAGTYHCEVFDMFDNTTTISSKKKYIDRNVLNRLPVSVVAVVFGCFTFLVVLVSACCFIGVLFRETKKGEKSILNQKLSHAYEDELDMSEYHEDINMVRLARWEELDSVSEASANDGMFVDETADEP
ncbi:platelet endothelial cell adhesion molecule isoform X2 [Corythoichthys intestinalis]|uniref:platelet endothelial cell adhesion molecule isoform X2 n=1 Tax=Corythoichthys intestinalis TaxID=161448 RepID=UPI0025A66D57|nr:platelet endothelial cell adhesion molecule isoform X2 [Corythoichthys intestinalis]